MQVTIPDGWPDTVGDAIAVQDSLRPLVDATDPRPPDFRTIAGIDSAYDESGLVAAAAVVLEAPTWQTATTSVAIGEASFPYVPGLLAFRELPTALAALEQLDATPDLLICDGQGLAHPRRFGLACHLGILAGIPTIGVAKNAWGDYTDPGPQRGARGDIRIDGEVVGRVLRTRTGVRPLFVSVGHLVDLDTACEQVLALTPHYRQPETTRQADQMCRRALRDAVARRQRTLGAAG
ncbi:endonuclease V [Nocardia bovistercoris]|uniref:Endonuclease V n=1 Tax=Nocardia bovistercoris TaxID=2785916 RepID=A0A931N1I2_9NOCA|nr:endonuclease V [Nocardia bovistercoris]MBH0775732.1 endonuclease V [Nocardia bovistercoris]